MIAQRTWSLSCSPAECAVQPCVKITSPCFPQNSTGLTVRRMCSIAASESAVATQCFASSEVGYRILAELG